MKTDSSSIAGRVALVTGNSRKQDSVDEVAAAIRARGGKAHAIAAHVGRLQDIERLLKQIEERGLELHDRGDHAGERRRAELITRAALSDNISLSTTGRY